MNRRMVVVSCRSGVNNEWLPAATIGRRQAVLAHSRKDLKLTFPVLTSRRMPASPYITGYSIT
jgi:hypothetical protein